MKEIYDEYDVLIEKYNKEIVKLKNDIFKIKYRLKYKRKIFDMLKANR